MNNNYYYLYDIVRWYERTCILAVSRCSFSSLISSSDTSCTASINAATSAGSSNPLRPSPRLAMSFCVPNCRSIIFVFARTIAREVVGSEKIDVKCNPLNDLVGSAKQYNCD